MEFSYSLEKSSKLFQEREISFEEILTAIEAGNLLDVIEHPNHERYGNQEIFVVRAKGYIYLVPFVKEENGNIFLKTIIPSRKAKKMYR